MVEFKDTGEEATFRTVVRDFIGSEYEPRREQIRTEGRQAAMFDRTPSMRAWEGELAQRGWIAPAWPEQYGGAGLSVMKQFIFNEEMAEARAPRPGGIAIGMAGPTLITIGTEEQQAEHLPPILSGEAVWCQGYSEPGSGSDLASLQTRAVKDGDDWVVNGQKIWTSGAHRADWMIMLARTDPDAPKHKGITYFMLDMHSPGVEVRPLVNMTNTHEFNEVFFEDVRIPSRHILGEVDRGWYGAVTTLDFERSSIGSAVGMRQGVEHVIDFAKENRGSGISSLGENEETRFALADRYIEAQTAMMISYRIVSMQSQGLIPNYEASMAKLYAMELNQRIQATAMKVMGLYGQLGSGDPYAPRRGRYQYSFLRSIANTIEGGTSEIQRNIIATRGLGLPTSSPPAASACQGARGGQ